MYAMQVPARSGSRAPLPGEHAGGHGVHGIVATVPPCQPLAADEIWRVTLVGEPYGRLLRASPDGDWHLLELGELTEAQLDALEAAAGTPSPC
jgi:hypothetical protein